ncbi:MAG TPA: hypothetical protein VFE96_07805, partial [Candidatus Bathyarchaeia archaeon]|nr:hypothetical protein [Candidatus Bathyarchaeia archaeon]
MKHSVNTLVAVAILVLLTVSFAPVHPAKAALTGLRVDPEALGILSNQDSTASTVAVSGNVQISVQHFPGKTISHTEPSAAVSISNKQNVLVGYHDRFPVFSSFVCAISISNDGGASYTFTGATPLSQSTDFCSDAAVAAHPDGSFYYAYLSVRNAGDTTDLRVAKVNSDGSVAFSTLAVKGDPAVNFPDKEYIAVDGNANSPFKGTIYVTWTEFLLPNDPNALDNGQIRIVKSTDGGVTWSSPLALSPDALFPRAISGSDPVVAPDGTLYVFYADFTSGTGPTSIRFVKSTDGGNTFSAPSNVARNVPSPGRFRLQNADPNFGITPGRGFRSNSFPSAAVSPDGSLSVVWTDFSSGSCTPDGTGRPPCSGSDIRYASSLDGGSTWTHSVTVVDDGNGDKFFPWISAQPSGRVNIVWGDKRLDSQNINYDVFYTSTTDHGKSFTVNHRISTATSIIGTATFIGDYFNLADSATTLQAVWDDRRTGINEIEGATI